MDDDIIGNDFQIDEMPLFSMSKSEIIGLINESLDMKNWTIGDLANGKEIDVFSEWKSIIGKIIWDYRFAGWEVFHYKTSKREYLSFTNPNKRMFGDKIKE